MIFAINNSTVCSENQPLDDVTKVTNASPRLAVTLPAGALFLPPSKHVGGGTNHPVSHGKPEPGVSAGV